MSINLSSPTETVWALHNFLRSWSIYNLTETELKLLLSALSESELRMARVCKKDEKTWQGLDRKNRHAFLFEKGARDHFDSTGYPEQSDVRQDSITAAEYFIIKPNKVIKARLHARHDVSVSCRILGTNQEFQTQSLDISEGGLNFKDLIPAWVAGYFLVMVNDKFQLMCSLVEDQKEKKRVQIVSEENDPHYILYKNWLATLK